MLSIIDIIEWLRRVLTVSEFLSFLLPIRDWSYLNRCAIMRQKQ